MQEKYARMSLLDRMVAAVERVRDRLARATAALDKAAIPYAVAGSSAVVAWIASVDPDAVRNTNDVDVLLHRKDFEQARNALESAGFFYHTQQGRVLFLESATSTSRHAVRIFFEEGQSETETAPCAPSVHDCTLRNGIRVLNLEPLVWMKVKRFALNDRVDLRDMLDIGLIDASWKSRLPADLAARLQHLLDTPEG
jgi:hypothetical protein